MLQSNKNNLVTLGLIPQPVIISTSRPAIHSDNARSTENKNFIRKRKTKKKEKSNKEEEKTGKETSRWKGKTAVGGFEKGGTEEKKKRRDVTSGDIKREKEQESVRRRVGRKGGNRREWPQK